MCCARCCCCCWPGPAILENARRVTRRRGDVDTLVCDERMTARCGGRSPLEANERERERLAPARLLAAGCRLLAARGCRCAFLFHRRCARRLLPGQWKWQPEIHQVATAPAGSGGAPLPLMLRAGQTSRGGGSNGQSVAREPIPRTFKASLSAPAPLPSSSLPLPSPPSRCRAPPARLEPEQRPTTATTTTTTLTMEIHTVERASRGKSQDVEGIE